MSEIEIRLARPHDLEEILQHRRAMFHDDGYTDAAALDAVVANSRAFIQRGLAEGWYQGWFAVVEGEIGAGAGLIIMPWVAHPNTPYDGLRAYVLNVYTHPQYRRRGLARKLMETIIEHCRERGMHTVWLHASKTGRFVYESMGFVSTNEMKLGLR